MKQMHIFRRIAIKGKCHLPLTDQDFETILDYIV